MIDFDQLWIFEIGCLAFVVDCKGRLAAIAVVTPDMQHRPLVEFTDGNSPQEMAQAA